MNDSVEQVRQQPLQQDPNREMIKMKVRLTLNLRVKINMRKMMKNSL